MSELSTEPIIQAYFDQENNNMQSPFLEAGIYGHIYWIQYFIEELNYNCNNKSDNNSANSTRTACNGKTANRDDENHTDSDTEKQKVTFLFQCILTG